jgi:hypothetical protein
MISFSALLAVILCCAIARGTARGMDSDWGEPVNGLQISISRVNDGRKSSGLGAMQINLHNSGTKDLYTIPGTLQFCGERNLAENFILRMTDSKGIVFQIGGPFIIVCGGAIEPFTLPLPAGTTFSIPVDLNNYFYMGVDGKELPKHLSTQLKPGEFTIQAEFTGADIRRYDDLRTDEQKRADEARPSEAHRVIGAGMTSWRGTAKSNELRVSFTAEELSKKYKDGW